MSCWTLPNFAKHMKRDPAGRGSTHLGKDGVLRTLTGDYEVIDARGLKPEEIKQILDTMPPQMARMVQKEDFRDVDGTKVTSEEALFHPAPGILPTRPSEAEAAEIRKLAKQRQEAYLQAKREQCAEME